MKIHTKTTLPLMALFVTAVMMTVPSAFAEDAVTIETAAGSGAPGCEETAEGCYLPTTVTVNVGGIVTMDNTDTAAHTFTAGTPADGPSGEFDTGLLMAANSFEYTADAVGEIPYFCMVHPWMIGTIIVQEAGASEPTAPMTKVVEIEQMMAEIMTSEGTANEPMSIDLTLTDLEGSGIEHITYKIMATQGTEVLLDEEGHMHNGVISNNHVTSALPQDASEEMPVVITVESVGFGHDEGYVEFTGEIATKQVVPEFGTIALMVLSVAIISIVAITAKSKLSLMPRL